MVTIFQEAEAVAVIFGTMPILLPVHNLLLLQVVVVVETITEQPK
jgi:hypothetical protein